MESPSGRECEERTKRCRARIASTIRRTSGLDALGLTVVVAIGTALAWAVWRRAQALAPPSALDFQIVPLTSTGHASQSTISGDGKYVAYIETVDDADSLWIRDTATAANVQIVKPTPGEGIFGVTLVASNGRGVAGARPAAGDTPDWWIEVDTTKPNAKFTKIHTAIDAWRF